MDGVHYDPTEVPVEVSVSLDEHHNLVVKYNGEDSFETPVFTNTYEADGKAVLKAKKAANSNLGDRTFQFELLDASKTVLQTSDPVKQNETAAFADISYVKNREKDQTGTYTYYIKEVVPEDAKMKNGRPEKDGVTYDTSEKKVEVVVADNGDGTLKVTYDGKNEFTTPVFSNNYTAEGEAQLSAKKKESTTLGDKEFTFALYDGDSTEPIVVSDPVKQGETAEFPKFTIQLSDIGGAGKTKDFTYKIKEVLPDGATAENNYTVDGVTYDPHVEEVVLTVKDEGNGTLSVKYNGKDTFTTPEFENEYDAKGKLTLSGSKTITNKPASMDLSGFKFTVKEGDTVVATGTSAADGKITFTDIVYADLSKAGKHTYVVSEDADTKPGVTNTTTTQTVKVTVADQGDGTLVATADNDSPAAIDAVNFENTYGAKGKLTLSGSKTITNKPASMDLSGFKFTVKEGDTVVATGTSAANGNITFTDIVYADLSKAGKHTYVVSEDADTKPGVTNTTTTKTVKVTVADQGDGTLVATADDDSPAAIDAVNFENTYSASGSLTLSGKKTITNKPASMDLSGFKFTVKEGETTVATGASDADGNITFGAITYSLDDVGKHTYVVSEDADTKPGVTNTTTPVTVIVTVSDNGDGTLNVAKAADGKVEINAVNFTNEYKTSGTGEVKVKKTLEGRAWTTADSFEFTITPIGEAPAFTPNTLTITSTDADYTKSFGEVTFTKAGTYQWTVSETHHGETIDGVAYDSADKTVTIVVKDDGEGHLIAEEGSALVQTAEFTNTYSKSGEGEVKVLKNLIGRNWATDDSFEFTITPVGNAPAFSPNKKTVTKDSASYTEELWQGDIHRSRHLSVDRH